MTDKIAIGDDKLDRIWDKHLKEIFRKLLHDDYTGGLSVKFRMQNGAVQRGNGNKIRVELDV